MTFSTYLSPGVALQGGGSGGGGAASAPLTGTGATITTSQPLIDVSQTWNNAAVTFTSAKINVTNTASAAASLLMDLQVDGVSKFNVTKGGLTYLTSSGFEVSTTGTAGAATRRLVASNGLYNVSTNYLYWSSSSSDIVPIDLQVGRRGPANFGLGPADAASATPQFFSVQSVVAGASNTAGAAFTINGSQSTGSGIGGSIIFQTAAANSGGGATVQNTLATAMVIDSVKTVRLGTGYTVATLPAAGTAGRRTYVTDALAPTFLGGLTGGGAVVSPVFDNGTAWVSA